jgi:hypothetical protein
MSDHPVMNATGIATVNACFFYECLTNRCCWFNYYRLDSNYHGIYETVHTNKIWRSLHDGIGL